MPKSIIISGGKISAADARFMNRSKNKKRKKFAWFLVYLAVIACVASALFIYAASRARPVIAGMAAAHARYAGARIVGEAVDEEIARSGLTYGDLISFEKTADGKITALKTDILNVNRLKSNLSVMILSKLEEMDNIILHIPAGNLFGGGFLSGRGPAIEIILIPLGSVITDIRGVFAPAGINQTRHSVMLDVTVSVSIIMPFSVQTAEAAASVVIAETIIVGDVPDVYVS
jgi:sporulation protein YunB